ncbi:hypothetical protein CRYUN_Cryun09bG0169900 [Craigia yunnanensis]
MGEEIKAVIPESLLKKKKKKRNEEWELAKKQDLETAKKKKVENRKLIYSRAKQYAKEYEAQEKELIQLKQEAKLKGVFYVDLEAKLLFIIRIRGINAMHPRTRKILQLLRLRQVAFQIFSKTKRNMGYGNQFPTLPCVEIEEGINKRLSRMLDRQWKKSIVVRPPPFLKKLRQKEAAEEVEKSVA